jgi:uncharacterized short protein YbdD (DUF466 family)
MRFLDPDLLYPPYEEMGLHDEELLKAYSDYSNYLESIQDRLPKKLIKAYKFADRFHDYRIAKLIYYGDGRIFKKDKDKIEMVIDLDDNEIQMTFDNVVLFELKNDLEVESDCPACGIEDILICELGITDKNYFSIEFCTSSNATILIHFKKFDFCKRVKRPGVIYVN